MCKGELFCVVAMKEYGEGYPFLNSVLHEGEYLLYAPAALPLRKQL
jgi:hypothetical protein